MSLFRHVRPLFTTSLTTEDKIGPVYAVLPSDSDATPDHAMEMRLMVQLPTPPAPIRGAPVLGVLGCVPCEVPAPAPVTPVPVVVVPDPAPVVPVAPLPPLAPAPIPGSVMPVPGVAIPIFSPFAHVPVVITSSVEDTADSEPLVEAEPPVPVATVVVETSTDRVSWAPVAEPFAIEQLPILTDIVTLGPYVRARTVSSGVSHEVEVDVLANASFRLELA